MASAFRSTVIYTGIAALSARLVLAKLRRLILPAMRQLFAYRTHDPQKKLSGIVLEVKGDPASQLRKILQDSGREPD